MRDDLTQRELDRIVYGEPPKVVAKFFDKQVLDVAASNDAGHRVNKVSTYIHLECVKEQAKFERPASEQDKREHAKAWAEYTQEKESERLRQVQDASIEEGSGCALIGPGYAQTG